MGNELSTLITEYYSDSNRKMPFLPFLVAPVGNMQDTIIVAPQSIAYFQKTFVNSLYSDIGNTNLRSIAARTFIFDSKLCIAVILPTELSDVGGRHGLKLSLGFFIQDEHFRLRSSILAEYLELIFDNFNRIFNISLPKDGGGWLINQLQSNVSSESRQLFILKLSAIIESLLMASIAVGEISKSKSSWIDKIKWKFVFGKKLPKAIFYPAGINQQFILNIYLRELGKCLNRKGRTIVQEMTDNRQQSIDLMPVVEFSEILASANKAKLNKINGKSYLNIY